MIPHHPEFDLEAAIRRWVKSLVSSPGLDDGHVAELESGLRDEIASLLRRGASPEEAFAGVTAEMGRPEDIGAEFLKARARGGSVRPSRLPSRLMPALAGNYLKVALRKIRRHKGYSFINIAGLAVGLAACFLILLWVRDEISYDRYHENADRVYRLAYTEVIGGGSFPMAEAPLTAGPAFVAEIPEVEACARIMKGNPLVIVGDRKYDMTSVVYAEPSFLRMFTCRFLGGDPATALAGPGSIVLTEDSALRLFGRTDVVGESLNLNHAMDFRVTGVVQNVPANSHFRWNALVSFSTISGKKELESVMNSWFRVSGWVYLLLKENADRTAVESKMASIAARRASAEDSTGGTGMIFELQKLTDIHLRSHLPGELGANGDIRFVYAFSLVALFILALAAINFTNLATARSAGRGKEVGLRKTLGAERRNLVLQFLGESVLMAGLAAAGAVALTAAALPAFNRLAGKSLTAGSLFTGAPGFAVLGLTLLTGLFAGAYPALFFSSFRPAAVLKGPMSRGFKRSSFRSVLVVFQFSVSIVLIAATLILLAQLSYMKTADLGFDKDQILVVRVKDPSMRKDAEAVMTELKRNPAILQASLSNGLPGRITQSMVINMEGRPASEGYDTNVIRADTDFVPVYGIKMVKGRNFSKEFGSDKAGVFLINETLARQIGWGESAVGRKIGFSPEEMGEIVGIMKDFHYDSLKDRIGALCLRFDPSGLAADGNYLSLKIGGGSLPAAVAFVKSLWAARSEREFEYFFADDNFDALYRLEESAGRVLVAFSVMAIFVACLGLFGLASFAAEQRTKEIGVRKVLGATETGLAALLSGEFIRLVLLANVLALPAAYVLMESLWLRNFAYRTHPGAWIFALTAALSLFIALATVSFQAVRAAAADPVRSLRYE